MANFGLKEAALGAALVLAPSSIAAEEKPEPTETAETLDCDAVEQRMREEIRNRLVNHGLSVSTWNAAPLKARQRCEEEKAALEQVESEDKK